MGGSIGQDRLADTIICSPNASSIAQALRLCVNVRYDVRRRQLSRFTYTDIICQVADETSVSGGTTIY